MNIFFIKSSNDQFEKLVQQVGNLAKLKAFTDEASLILSLASCDAVLLDMDYDPKKSEKIIKSIRKSDIVKPIMVLCNSLIGDKLKKHQNSRYAADIYLTFPMDLEVLAMMIEASMNSHGPTDTKTFSLDLNGLSDVELSESEDIVSSDEFSHELDLSDDSPEISIHEDEPPFRIDEDVTMGAMDLSDLSEATRVVGGDESFSARGSESDEDDESLDSIEFSIGGDEPFSEEATDDILEKTSSVSNDELDAVKPAKNENNQLAQDFSDDSAAGLEFSFDAGLEVEEEVEGDFNTPSNMDVVVEEEEDDFQTKLREIDELLKDDTSANLMEQQLEGDDQDDYIEESLALNQEKEESEDFTFGSSKKDDSQNFEYSGSLASEHKEYRANHDGELLRLAETIKSLRLDRDELLKKVQAFEQKEHLFQDNLLSVRAELDEKKIENSILKKRHSQKVEDLNLKIELLTDKRMVLETKNKQFEEEFLKLRKDKMLDVNKVRSRERELEGKLELLRKDAEIQVRNRDQKILELKRRIDTLEFDIESSHIKERKSFADQVLLENKMNKVISTLRSAIGQLEEDTPDDKRRKKVKNNLDV